MRARPRHVLHATDFSPASRAAFTAAVQMAKRTHADLELLHVALPPAAYLESGVATPGDVERLAEATFREAERRLGALARAAARAGVRATMRVRLGIPVTAIVDEARRLRADVLVVGTHGRSGVPRVFLGSVAARVAALAPCAVLTVRGR